MVDQMDVVSVDLSQFGGPVFTGRPNGDAARKKLGLDQIDTTIAKVVVTVPADAYSLNSSFFLGLFGKSVRAAGSRDAFRNRFQFKSPEHLEAAIEVGIQRALQERLPLINR